jgi:hypothetical protein
LEENSGRNNRAFAGPRIESILGEYILKGSIANADTVETLTAKMRILLLTPGSR